MAEATGLRNNALPYPIYGLPFTVTFPMLDADGDLVTGATTPDAEVSKNGDTFADCTNESTEIATNSGMYYLTLTGTEMTADIVTVIAKSATAGMKTTAITLYPRKLVTLRSGTTQASSSTTVVLDASASAIDDYYNGCPVSCVLDATTEVRMITDYVGSSKTATVHVAWISGDPGPDTNDTFIVYLPEGRQVTQSDNVGWLATGIAAADTAGYPKVTIKDGTGTGEIDTTSGGVLVAAIAANAITATAINADALTAAKIAADVTTELQSGLATAAELAKVPKSDGTASWNATALAALQSEANDALVAYDPPTRAEATSDVNSVLAVLGTPANADLATDIGIVQATAQSALNNTGDILPIVKGLAMVPGSQIGDTGNNTTHLHLSGWGGVYPDDEINDHMLVVYDDSNETYYARWVSDWVASTELVTVATLPFTPENNTDLYWLLPTRRDVTAASIAAGAITAAAIATDAIDADALATDAITEIWNKAMSDLAAVPAANASVLAAINWMFELARNKLTQTATTGSIFKDDASTTLATTTVSDDLTTFTRGEWA